MKNTAFMKMAISAAIAAAMTVTASAAIVAPLSSHNPAAITASAAASDNFCFVFGRHTGSENCPASRREAYITPQAQARGINVGDLIYIDSRSGGLFMVTDVVEQPRGTGNSPVIFINTDFSNEWTNMLPVWVV